MGLKIGVNGFLTANNEALIILKEVKFSQERLSSDISSLRKNVRAVEHTYENEFASMERNYERIRSKYDTFLTRVNSLSSDESKMMDSVPSRNSTFSGYATIPRFKTDFQFAQRNNQTISGRTSENTLSDFTGKEGIPSEEN
jgi:hypothetical protein